MHPSDPAAPEPIEFDADFTDELGRTFRVYFESRGDQAESQRITVLAGPKHRAYEVDVGDLLDARMTKIVEQGAMAAYDAYTALCAQEDGELEAA